MKTKVKNKSIETLALSKMFKAKETSAARADVPPGCYEVHMTVQVNGTINVGEDTERKPTVSIPVKDVLALFLKRSGATREATKEALVTCMCDALKGIAPGGTGAFSDLIDDTWKEVVSDVIDQMPKTKVKGAVKSDLDIDIQ